MGIPEEVRLNEHIVRKIKEEVSLQVAAMFGGEERWDALRPRKWVARFFHRSVKTIEEWQRRGWLPELIRIGNRNFWRGSKIREVYRRMQHGQREMEDALVMDEHLIYEIDFLNMIQNRGGVDEYAEIRAALGFR